MRKDKPERLPFFDELQRWIAAEIVLMNVVAKGICKSQKYLHQGACKQRAGGTRQPSQARQHDELGIAAVHLAQQKTQWNQGQQASACPVVGLEVTARKCTKIRCLKDSVRGA